MLLGLGRRGAAARMLCGAAGLACRAVSTAAAAMDTATRQKAYVRYKPSEDSITISLTVAGRQRNLFRPVDEPLEKPLARLRANLAPDKAKKVRKRAGKDAAGPSAAASAEPDTDDDTVALYADADASSPIDGATPNLRAWTSGALLRLGPCWYDLVLNPPTVDALACPGFPMADHPVLPAASLSFADADACGWRWLRRRPGAEEGWQDTGCTALSYTPSGDDVGWQLRVEVTPGRWAPAAAGGDGAAAGQQRAGTGGEQEQEEAEEEAAAAAAAAAAGQGVDPHTLTTLDLASAAAAAAASAAAQARGGCQPRVTGPAAAADTGPVAAAPAAAAARVRCAAGPDPPAVPPALRVMSYNILADQYAGTAYAQNVLFKYCPTPLLDNNYRRQLVLQEVAAYQPDVLCCQEVDDKVFSEFLAPHLALAGYQGAYTNKQGRVREGSALFWRRSRLQLVARHDVLLRDVFAPPLAPRHAQLQPLLDASPALVEALQKVTTVAQLALLVPAPSGGPEQPAAAQRQAQQQPGGGVLPPVLVVNTHLFFHPFAPHIRTLHTAAILAEAHAAAAAWAAGQPHQVHPAAPPRSPPSEDQHAQRQQDQQDQQQQQQQDAQQRQGGGGRVGVSWVSPQARALLAGRPSPTLLFCGDLNSDLNDGVPGVVQLLGAGALPADHWDWKYGEVFRWGKEEGEYTDSEAAAPAPDQDPAAPEQRGPQPGPSSSSSAAAGAAAAPAPAAPSGAGGAEDAAPPPAAAPPLLGLDLRVPYALRSADALLTPYTNYTSGYQALLDYVWYDPRQLQVARQLPVPTPEALGGFIPNAAFPSDHLAVVYDLRPATAAAAAAAAADGAGAGAAGPAAGL